VWLCHWHHALEHRAWRAFRIDVIADETEARLLRLRFFFVRLGCVEGPVELVPSLSAELARCLSRVLDGQNGR
jgi:hypothetical protein